MSDNLKKDNSNKIVHLKMIQDNIKRFSRNSFTIKSWNITLLTAFIAYTLQLRIDSMNALIITVSFTLGFMALDWYYLNLEKSYRNLYRTVREIANDGDIDFNMELNNIKAPNSIDRNLRAKFFYGIKRPVIYWFYGTEVLFILLFFLI